MACPRVAKMLPTSQMIIEIYFYFEVCDYLFFCEGDFYLYFGQEIRFHHRVLLLLSGRNFALDVGHIVGPLNYGRCDTKHRLPCTITPFD